VAQRQSGTAVADAPDTLPGDFFDKQKKPSATDAPDTLPSDFFDKQTPNATPPPAQSAGPAAKPGFLDRQKQILSDAWRMSPLGTVGEYAGKAGDYLQRKANESDEAGLRQAAQTGQTSTLRPIGRGLLGVGADVAHGLQSMSTPAGAAATAGAIALPEVAGPLMLAHGTYGAAQHGGALRDFATTGTADPDELQKGLGSLAEATGGAAGSGMGLRALGNYAFPGGEPNAGLQNLLEKPIKTVGEWGLRKVTGTPAPLRTLAGEPIDIAEGREAMNTDVAKERQTRAGAHSQMEKELAARGQVQTAAHNQMETDLAAREAAKLKGNPTPFGQGMTSTSAPGGANLELPTVPEGPAPEPAAKIVAKGEKPQKSLIVSPSEGVPVAKSTLQSYPREILAQRAARGDLAAARELQRNPGKIDVGAIPNLRYIGVRPLIQ